jgi:hypothetical protein
MLCLPQNATAYLRVTMCAMKWALYSAGLRACIAITHKPLACRTSVSLTRPTLSERLSGDDRRFLLLKRLHHGVIKLQVPPDQFRRCQRHPLVERDIGKHRTAEHLKKT